MSEKLTDFDIDAIPTMEPFDDLMSDDIPNDTTTSADEVEPPVRDTAVAVETGGSETQTVEVADEAAETENAKSGLMAWLGATLAQVRAWLATRFRRHGDMLTDDENEVATEEMVADDAPSSSATENDEAEDDDEPSASRRKRAIIIWIAVVAAAGLVLGVGVSLLSHSQVQRRRTSEIKQMKTQLQQMKTSIKIKNDEINTLRRQTAAKPLSAPKAKPLPVVVATKTVAPSKKNTPVAVAPCIITGQKNAASSLKECIGAFNAAEKGH